MSSSDQDALPVEAAFACSICGKRAGLIRLDREATRTEVRRESWPGVAIYPLSDEAVPSLQAALLALLALDVPRLFESS